MFIDELLHLFLVSSKDDHHDVVRFEGVFETSVLILVVLSEALPNPLEDAHSRIRDLRLENVFQVVVVFVCTLHMLIDDMLELK